MTATSPFCPFLFLYDIFPGLHNFFFLFLCLFSSSVTFFFSIVCFLFLSHFFAYLVNVFFLLNIFPSFFMTVPLLSLFPLLLHLFFPNPFYMILFSCYSFPLAHFHTLRNHLSLFNLIFFCLFPHNFKWLYSLPSHISLFTLLWPIFAWSFTLTHPSLPVCPSVTPKISICEACYASQAQCLITDAKRRRRDA